MDMADSSRCGELKRDTRELWPALGCIGLSVTDKQRRRDYVGGSDANVIMGGDVDRLLGLWRGKRGEEVAELPTTLAMVMGTWTEELNRQWFERETEMPVSDVGLFAVS